MTSAASIVVAAEPPGTPFLAVFLDVVHDMMPPAKTTRVRIAVHAPAAADGTRLGQVAEIRRAVRAGVDPAIPEDDDSSIWLLVRLARHAVDPSFVVVARNLAVLLERLRMDGWTVEASPCIEAHGPRGGAA